MEDVDVKAKYNKCKMRVKMWEHEFRKQKGRMPSKHDIRDAPSHIRNSYKLYYKLKTSLLEDSLCGILSEHGDGSLNFSELQPQDLSSQDLMNILSQSSQQSVIEPAVAFDAAASFEVDVSSLRGEQEAESIVALNENAWGRELNVPKPKDRKSIQPIKRQLSLSSKNFARKSIRTSFARSSSEISVTSSQGSQGAGIRETLPDLETLLAEKAKKVADIEVNLPVEPGPSKISKEVDMGWLNRCSSLNSLENSKENVNSANNARKSYGIANLNLSAINRSSLAPNLGDSSTSLGMSSLSLASTSTSVFSFAEERKYDQPTDESDTIISNSEDETSLSENVRHVIKKRKVMAMQPVADVAAGPLMEPVVEEPTVVAKKKVQQPVQKPKKTKKSIKSTTAPTSRRSSDRRQSKKVSYANIDSDDDPYAGDDSDKDPDFKQEKTAVVEDPVEELPVRRKKSILPKKRVGVVGKLKNKATKLLKAKNKVGVANMPAAGEEGVVETKEFNEYILEFGIERVQNVPRVQMEDFEKTKNLFDNYLQASITSYGTAKKSAPPTSGYALNRAQERAALEAKIKSGKLNENFVRIDIQKKRFVRGKKTMNFSKYKRSLWKKKKEAALTGPDMDMGGCDGGMLTCFLCNGIGHFARNCKALKGDQLLPVDVQVEDASPFPTLEEAEEMANIAANVVHSTKPEAKPAVANPLWRGDVAAADKEEIEVHETSTEEEPEVAPAQEEAAKKVYIGHQIPEDFLIKSGILDVSVGSKDKTEPLYPLNPDGTIISPTPPEVFEALRLFGHKGFRNGQETAIMRILSGQSTLVTLSTGSGKSLCYQLPAYLYSQKMRCITLVISPLVSLMEDQVVDVPDFLNAQCLHTNQTPRVRELVMDNIKSGNVNILLVSPEAVVAGEKSTGFGSLLRQLPPIAFACIDEAHCVSQWSHNFRPSYLMICRVLKEKLGVKIILGLTATATYPTRESIVRHLSIHDGVAGIISDTPLPDNLVLTASRDANRDTALLHLVKSQRFLDLKSIIIYCTRRDECERVAAFLRTCLQESNKSVLLKDTAKRKRVSWVAEPYHAGLTAARRRSIQNAFMKNDLRIVVATIAFGMGINKSDIRAILHYNMPKNFESYVQEVGRAGRDGLMSHCHLFLDYKGNDQCELRRHVYANSMDRHVIRKLLQKVFVPCACVQNFKDEKFTKEMKDELESLKNINWAAEFDTDEPMEGAAIATGSEQTVKNVRTCPGHEVCFSVESTVQSLDIPEENISTLLCYLELHEKNFIQVLSRAYTMCKVMSYGGANTLRAAAKSCPPLAMAIALDLKRNISHDKSTFIEFGVVDVAAAIGWDSGVVKYQLKNLEWTTENGLPKRSAISVSFFDLGFRVRAPGDLTDDELDDTLDMLYDRVTKQERAQLLQLQCVSDALKSVAFPTYMPCSTASVPTGPSDKLKSIIREYFQNDYPTQIELKAQNDGTSDEEILSDIRSLIHQYPENNFTGRTLARIFHGIQSPNYPAVIWGRCKYWRVYMSTDFNRIVALANTEIVRMRSS